jgi:hypothetical protein
VEDGAVLKGGIEVRSNERKQNQAQSQPKAAEAQKAEPAKAAGAHA